jgi:hypothetical protein
MVDRLQFYKIEVATGMWMTSCIRQQWAERQKRTEPAATPEAVLNGIEFVPFAFL